MFSKSENHTVPDLFNNIVGQMDGVRIKMYLDTVSWHNIFHKYVISQIDESIFKCLFDEGFGRPNAPLRILTGMMILKEGFGWSDKELFDECYFNLKVMGALGFTNYSDRIPCEATYYNFRQSLSEHQVETGEDLIGDLFRNLTKEQAKLFGVTGEFALLDSKLIGSNICKSSRLQLIIRVLQEFYKDICKQETLLERMDSAEKSIFDDLIKKNAGQITYVLNKEEREQKLKNLGYLLASLLKKYTEKDSDKVRLLLRVFSEHYRMESETIVLKDVSELKASSLQSPYDEDAEYRKKHEQEIQGNSMNVLETNNPDSLNLIGDVDMEGATAPDNGFFEEPIKRSQKIFGHIEQANVDGAYYSESNQKFAEENHTTVIYSGLPGNPGKYAFENKEDGKIAVTNIVTNEVQIANEYKPGKYKIKENGKIKYFDIESVINFIRRKEMEAIPQWVKNMRNNVEATIFHMCCTLRNNKTRYRGSFKNKLWGYCRAMWINARRIEIYLGEVRPDGTSTANIAVNFIKKTKFVKFVTTFVEKYFLNKEFGRSIFNQMGNIFSLQKL
jgi:hypothetical protein